MNQKLIKKTVKIINSKDNSMKIIIHESTTNQFLKSSQGNTQVHNKK